jgi:outer membrane protein OmpA-like peptidoglycan-associated protein/tetratricopeptide (TPR) repeat protein
MKLKFPILIVLVALLLAGFGQVHAQGKKRKSELKKTKELLDFEEYQNAIPHIQELLTEDSQNAYYNFWMGKCLYLTYKKNQALPYLKTVEAVNPDVDEEFHYYYALTLHYNLNFDKAIEEYRKDLERYATDSPEFNNVNNRISQCLYAKKVSKTPDNNLVKINNMGESINSEYSEHSPVISADNATLIYTARRPDSRGADVKSAFYDEDIYVSKNQGENWSTGQNIGQPVNSKGHDATISLTADGQTLYLYRHKKDGGLYRTDFDPSAKKWDEPRAIQKPLNSKYYEASICQSADSSLMFFTSNRPGGFGGLDIYMAQREGKNDWSEPRNLGPRINTPFNEDAPYFHPDGRTLYYSSNGPNSLGGFDIFVTEYDSAGGDFMLPLNMGSPINSPDDEIYFVLSADGLHGYYTSGKEGGFGEKDIYEIKFPYSRYPKRYYAIEVVGLVQDANTLDTLPSKVRLIDQALGMAIDSMEINAAVGKYSFSVEPTRAYSVEVSTDGYDNVKEDFTTPEIKGEDVTMERNLYVKRARIITENKEGPALEHLYYDFDKADLRATAKQELDMAIELLKQNENLRIEVVGHTDWYGNYDYNVALSERRTHAASKYLHEKGIDEGRIIEKWLSETKPLESNEDDRGRQFNRRTEMRFVDNKDKVAFASMRVRPGSEGPYVDHTKPKGLPGFDFPGAPMSAKPDESDIVSNATASIDPNTTMTTLADAFAAADAPAATNVAASNGLDLHNIYFDFDKAQLRNAAQSELQKIANVMQAHPQYQLVIKGHTDAFGSTDYNQTLSEMRCAEAFEFLSAQGLPVSRMSFAGFSETTPLGNNDDDTGRQANRRVEFELRDGNKVIYRSRP